MLGKFQRLKYSIIYFLIALAIFFVCRIFFYAFNVGHFQHLIILSFLWGFRYDISAICLTYALFFILLMLPVFPINKITKNILAVLFIIPTIVAFFFNLTDTIYYEFTGKRTTADIIAFMKTSGNMRRLIPRFALDYWYVVLIFLLLIAGAVYVLRKIPLPDAKMNYKQVYAWFRWLLTLSLLLIGFRGGFQLKPITIVNAAQDVNSANIALTLNTPFTFFKTVTEPVIEPKKYMSKKAADALFSPIQTINGSGNFKKKNVVIIILESFSKEYTGYFNHGKGFTPFLDSLMRNSMIFQSGFSNGKTSIEGIPAVTASIPTVMGDAFITSPYGGDQINSLASVLDKEGYYTAFFHGGDNGTMGFDAFAKVAGYQHYFGRSQYPHPKRDYDGTWGIWDEPYLQYFAHQLNQKKQPFFATIFTLSSHHPFIVPKKYKGKFPEGKYKILKCVAYADFALKRFFKTASTMPWYNNTLFVLTADHTSISSDKFYTNRLGNFTVPIIFFDPGAKKGYQPQQKVMQQADIFPSILGYLGYKGKVYAFGQNVFNPNEHGFVIDYESGVYQIIDKNYILLFDGKKINALYHYKTDSLLQNNLLSKKKATADSLCNTLKAYIQQYNTDLVANKMTVSKSK